jgi:multidrug efflux pump subunit AcrA (membrane-fusion protein)
VPILIDAPTLLGSGVAISIRSTQLERLRPQATYDAAVAGPTWEERAIADAQVQAAAAAVTVLERRLDKMVLRAPADGVVTVIAAECSHGPTDTDGRSVWQALALVQCA